MRIHQPKLPDMVAMNFAELLELEDAVRVILKGLHDPRFYKKGVHESTKFVLNFSWKDVAQVRVRIFHAGTAETHALVMDTFKGWSGTDQAKFLSVRMENLFLAGDKFSITGTYRMETTDSFDVIVTRTDHKL